MRRSILLSSVTACIWLSCSVPVFAADPSSAGAAAVPASNENNASGAKLAEKCLSDLRAFDIQMDKEGYWLGGSGYGYGYPMAGFGFGPPMMENRTEGTGMDYQNARPGYELRTLIAAADILARQGQLQPCEDVLNITRAIYKTYVADMHNGKMPEANVQSWRQQQLASAQPVTGMNTALRTDELVGTEVRTPQNDALGSVDDLVMSPQTGKVAYVVIARGGIFGIDEKYVPVPWQAFKIAPNVNLLVLAVSKGSLDTAPQASKDQFAKPGRFEQLSQKVDSYWKTHLSENSKD